MKNFKYIVFLIFVFCVSNAKGDESKDSRIKEIISVIQNKNSKEIQSIIHPHSLKDSNAENIEIFTTMLKDVSISKTGFKQIEREVNKDSYLFKITTFLHEPEIFVDLSWAAPTEKKPNKQAGLSLALAQSQGSYFLVPYVNDYMINKYAR